MKLHHAILKTMKRHKKHRRFSPSVRRIALVSALVLVGLFVILNAILWLMYQGRTYPGTRVMGHPIGSVAYADLGKKVDTLQLLPEKVIYTYDGKFIELPASEVGVRKDISRTTNSGEAQKFWLPLVNLFKKPTLLSPVTIDDKKLAEASQKIAPALGKEPISARLVLNGTNVSIQKEVYGYGVDNNSLKPALLASLDQGKHKAAVKVTVSRPQILASTLEDKKTDLEAQIKTPITFAFGGKTKQAGAADIAGWMVQSGESYVPSPEKVQAYIVAAGKELGIRVKDTPGTAAKAEQAVKNHQALTVTLVQQMSLKTFTYCTAVRGVDAVHLVSLKPRLQETYNSPRGWSLDGLVEFREVSSGCDFTVWLSAAAQMPSFGAICDSLWSCRVGPNVVINFDRWQNASEAWNARGGSLEDYRHMVINHETGHWFGFGHASCPGPGQPAPVMQQQSIDLQGCTFNPWPTGGELGILKRDLGI